MPKTIKPFAALLLASATIAAAPPAPPAPRWVATWASAQQIPEPQNAAASDDLHDATLRQIVHVSAGGRQLRVRFSNAFGTAPLAIDGAHVALARAPSGAALIGGSDRALLFGGAAGVVIPAGADYWSDPVDLDVRAGADLAISLHLPDAPARQTGHPGSRSTSYILAGAHGGDGDLPGAKTIDHWYQLASVEIAAPSRAGAVVAFGDSITDGHGATTNGNDRWPDDLAARLQADPRTASVSVLNAGIGGNRLLQDGLGPNALARFDRDVLSPAGVRTVLVLEGINDLGTLTRERPVGAADHAALVAAMIGAYRQMIARAHAHGVRIVGCTVMPDGGSGYYHPDAANEADRQAVNDWIRRPGHFDAVVDFDAVVRDPADARRLRAAFDSGDHLHPSPAGYRAMADAIPVALFADQTDAGQTHRR